MNIELIRRNKINLIPKSAKFPVDKLPTWSVVQLNFQLLRSINNGKLKLKWNARSKSNLSSQNSVILSSKRLNPTDWPVCHDFSPFHPQIALKITSFRLYWHTCGRTWGQNVRVHGDLIVTTSRWLLHAERRCAVHRIYTSVFVQMKRVRDERTEVDEPRRLELIQ